MIKGVYCLNGGSRSFNSLRPTTAHSGFYMTSYMDWEPLTASLTETLCASQKINQNWKVFCPSGQIYTKVFKTERVKARWVLRPTIRLGQLYYFLYYHTCCGNHWFSGSPVKYNITNFSGRLPLIQKSQVFVHHCWGNVGPTSQTAVNINPTLGLASLVLHHHRVYH